MLWMVEGSFCGLFLFASNGLVVTASVNNPGSWHDNAIARNTVTYEKFKEFSHELMFNAWQMLLFL